VPVRIICRSSHAASLAGTIRRSPSLIPAPY
jgi:hypothetical protein